MPCSEILGVAFSNTPTSLVALSYDLMRTFPCYPFLIEVMCVVSRSKGGPDGLGAIDLLYFKEDLRGSEAHLLTLVRQG